MTEETVDAAPADPLGIALLVRLGRLEIGMLARFVSLPWLASRGNTGGGSHSDRSRQAK